MAAACFVASCTSGGDPAAGAPRATPTGATPTAASTAASTTDPAPKVRTATTEPGTTDPGTTVAVTAAPMRRCDPAGAVEDTGPITITVWHALNDAPRQQLDELVAEFELGHPNIDVEVVVYDEGYAAQRAALDPGDPAAVPDLFLGTVSDVRALHDAGLFIPPSACTGGEAPEVAADLLPVIRATFEVDGQLAALPFNISTPLLMYDRLRFERAGLDPDDPPQTLDELRDVAARGIASGEAASGLLLYDLSGSWLIEQWAAQVGETLLSPDNGRGGVLDQATLATPDITGWMTWAQQMHDDGLVEWLDLNQSGIEDLARMVDPDRPGLLTLHTSAALGDIVALQEAGAPAEFEVGVAPLPGPGTGALAGGWGWWLPDRGDPTRAGAAWLLAEWLLEPQQQATYTAATGYVPATRSAAEHEITQRRWAEYPVFAVGYEQLAGQPDTYAASGMQAGPRQQIQRTLELAAAAIISQGADPSAELRRAEARIDGDIRAYDRLLATD